MAEMLKPEYIFETSWEVCNMVGGIYTVLSTRAATLQKTYGDNLIFIGPDIWESVNNPWFEEDKQLYSDWIAFTAQTYGLNIRVGRWVIPGMPLSVLVDFKPLMEQKDTIYGQVWEWAGVNSLGAYGDYDESSMFGYASGLVMESYFRFFQLTAQHNVVAHFNEWMTTFGAFYIRKHQPAIATVFTTHATSIGRSIAGNHKPLYDYLTQYNGDQMSYELNMVSKHSTEKQAAHLVDCFTTVSEITGVECEQLLDKKPDIITPNGFEADFVPQGRKFTPARNKARKALRRVAETLLGYSLPEDLLFVCTAGRYEYKNKGIDTFLESLKKVKDSGRLQKRLVAFVMVPAWTKAPRTDLAAALNNPELKVDASNRFCTHELHEPWNDPVTGAVNWFHFENKETDALNVIFVPAYLNGNDGIFNMNYYSLLIGMDLTVFPSYYEPWGYTPLESVAFSVPTITTDLSGFGRWASHQPQDIEEGVGVIHRSDYNSYQVSDEIAAMLERYAALPPKAVDAVRTKAAEISDRALWKNFIQFYSEAYHIALNNRDKRII